MSSMVNFVFLSVIFLFPHLIQAAPGHNDEVKIIIIKIGGSSITNKAQFETFNETSLDWFAQTVQKTLSSTYNKKLHTRLVIVHGAGSFGHYQAKEFGFRGVMGADKNHVNTLNKMKEENILDNPILSDKEHIGIAKTRLSVQTLHLKLISTLIAYGIPAVGVSPFALSPVYDEDLNLEALASSVTQIVNQGMIPVIHGDAVFQRDIGGAILGGDDIVCSIASHFARMTKSPDKIEENGSTSNGNNSMSIDTVQVTFITDVDGVFTSDPKFNPDAELVQLLEVSQEGKLIQLQGSKTMQATKSSHEHDVTGGLESKLKSAIEIAKQDVQVVIVRCGSTSAEKAVHGDYFPIGTTIRLQRNPQECVDS